MSQLLYLTSDGKVIMNSSGLVYLDSAASLPTSYEYRAETDGESVEITLANGKKVLLTYDERSIYPHHFSADFSLAVISDNCQWGYYTLSHYYMTKDIYLYDLGDDYGWGEQNPAAYIQANFTPQAILSWDYGSGTIYVRYS